MKIKLQIVFYYFILSGILQDKTDSKILPAVTTGGRMVSLLCMTSPIEHRLKESSSG